MRFYKYHGAGNDFIIIDSSPKLEKMNLGKLARVICDRRYGVGGDGLLVLEKSKEADARMRIFNPDGSEAEMCGNGIRCLARHAFDSGLVKKKNMRISTLAGVKRVTMLDGEVEVDLGKPEFEKEKIPAIGSGKFLEETIEGFVVSAVNMGVPHAVVFIEKLDSVDVNKVGKKIRTNKAFPRGTNVDFLEAAGKNRLRIRTYERGIENETLACGTGVSASAALAVALGKADPNKSIIVEATGGRFYVNVKVEDGEITSVTLRGPISFVFEGEAKLENLLR